MLKDKEKNFLETEELGVSQPKQKEAAEVVTIEQNVTLDETEELGVSQPKVPKEEAPEVVMIEQNVTLNLANNNVKTRYPAKDDLTQLQDNRGQAIGCTVSVEKKLIKDNDSGVADVLFAGYNNIDKVPLGDLSRWLASVPPERTGGEVDHRVDISNLPNDKGKKTYRGGRSNSKNNKNFLGLAKKHGHPLKNCTNTDCGVPVYLKVMVCPHCKTEIALPEAYTRGRVVQDVERVHGGLKDPPLSMGFVHVDSGGDITKKQEWYLLPKERLRNWDQNFHMMQLRDCKLWRCEKDAKEFCFPRAIEVKTTPDDGLGGGDKEVVDKLVGEEIFGTGTGPL